VSIAIETAVSFARTSMFRETRQWTERFADRTLGVKSSVIRDLLKLTERPDVISFAGGLPAPEVFPIARIEAATQRVLEERGQSALQYGTTEGYLPLREMLVRHMGRYGVRVTPDNVLVTAGAQQALDLVGKLFLNPGDIVLTEEPTYLGAIQAFTAYQAQYLTVPMDDEGLRMDDLETALHAGPKFLYVLPNFQNPGGTTLSRSRRERLVELATHYRVPIVEDDPYGQLRYEGKHLPPLAKIAADLERSDGSFDSFPTGVLYLGTLSKVLAPGLRIGWVVGPAPVISKLVQLKQGTDLHTSTFTQMVAHETARGGFLDRHIPPSARSTGSACGQCWAPSSATSRPRCVGRGRRGGSSSGSPCPKGWIRGGCWERRSSRRWLSYPGGPSSPIEAAPRACGSTSPTAPPSTSRRELDDWAP
jgi:2-aminoadipate transaminase